MIKENILTMQVHVGCLADAVQRVVDLARNKTGSYVCVSNVHMCMETFDSADFRNIVNQANLVVADGKPISIAQKLLGHPKAKQVRGQDLVHGLCEVAADKSLKIGFFGGSSAAMLQTVSDRLRDDYPGLQVPYAFSPPFRELTATEDKDVVGQIHAMGVDILFVGIGCPKQERWMANHKDRLTCVMLGVGAAFDFIAGSKQHAPRWMQHLALEWLFRLCREPKRLGKRYLRQNPRFLYHCGLQVSKAKTTGKKA